MEAFAQKYHFTTYKEYVDFLQSDISQEDIDLYLNERNILITQYDEQISESDNKLSSINSELNSLESQLSSAEKMLENSNNSKHKNEIQSHIQNLNIQIELLSEDKQDIKEKISSLENQKEQALIEFDNEHFQEIDAIHWQEVFAKAEELQLDEHHYSEDFNKLNSEIAKYNYDACTRLAYMNRNGEGIKINKRKAAELYSKVCQRTNKKCDTLAWMYYKGEGVRQDNQKFMQFSKQACDHNDYTGCQFIGYAYRDGNIVKQNKLLATQIFNTMCNMKTNNKFDKAIAQQSCIDVGFMYYNNGDASKPDIYLAKEYFGRGCNLGNSSGCKNYKILNEQGF